MVLRDYQLKLIDDINKVLEDKNSVVAKLGCGGGKSVIQADIAKNITDRTGIVFYFVHRDTLLKQIKNTFRNYGVNMSRAYIVGVKSFNKFYSKYPNLSPDLILVDEAHTNLEAYKQIFKIYPNAKKIGFTATPVRLKEGAIIDPKNGIFDTIVTSVSVRWLIDNNFLSDYRYYSLANFNYDKIQQIADTKAMEQGLKKGNNQYDEEQFNKSIDKELNKIMNKPEVYTKAVAEWLRIANGLKTVAYCSSIVNSTKLKQCFEQVGIEVAELNGGDPVKVREQIVDEFKNQNKYKVLINVNLFSEGFDDPTIECVMLLRPTKSYALHTQQAMRGMRFKVGKICKILDFVNNHKRHGLPDEEYILTPRELRTCPECNELNEMNMILCINCGHKLIEQAVEEDTTTCGSCKSLILKEQIKNNVCPECGKLVRLPSSAETIENVSYDLIEVQKTKEFEKAKMFNDRFYLPLTYESMIEYLKFKKKKLGKISDYCIMFYILPTFEELDNLRKEQGFKPNWTVYQYNNIYSSLKKYLHILIDNNKDKDYNLNKAQQWRVENGGSKW